MSTVLLCDSFEDDRALMDTLVAANPTWNIVSYKDGRSVLDRLDRLDAEPVHVIITDSEVPDMGPDELLERIRRKDPKLPVVLITAASPDEAAVRALRFGAANYVPRSTMARDLPKTVERLLALCGKTAPQVKLLENLQRTSAEFRMRDRALFLPLVSYVQDRLDELGYDAGDAMRMSLGFEEALSNALIHGNLEVDSSVRSESYDEYERLIEERLQRAPYKDRVIEVVTEISRESASIVIRDEGKGFDARAVPDLLSEPQLLAASGRGIFLMRAFFDDVRFNDEGNEVTLSKQRVPSR